MTRSLKYFEALREAQAQCLAADPSTYLIGLGVPGPTGIFGTTKGLQEEFGADRVMDMPSSENAMTGIALGTSLMGRRPVMIHMRVDFAVLSMEPLVNQIAKWSYMYGGQMKAPLTIRMIIGRGWGQGPQHSQSLQAWFAHVPGLKVVMPATAYDAKGMLIAAIRDDSPVIVFEHRWLYNSFSDVPENPFESDLHGARVVREGSDVTLVGASYMTLESIRAADLLAGLGIEAEIVDLRCLTPIDSKTIANSMRKTGRIVVSDTGHRDFGTTSEVVAVVMETGFGSLKARPERVGLPMIPTPTTPALADLYYPTARDIAAAALRTLGKEHLELPVVEDTRKWKDVPDPSFQGPY